MPRLKANEIEIEYDTFGDESARPLLLVMGLGTQMIAWDEEFCGALADQGHYVIRFDNRDVGLSTHFDDAGIPNIVELMAASARGEEIEVPYLLSDMADDAVGVLDALEISAAHLVGASMGGMIVQTMAIDHPGRVCSLTSIMSNTGRRGSKPPSPEAMKVLMEPPPEGREAAIEHGVANQKVIGSPGFPLDDERARRRAAAFYDRSFHPQGGARHLAAVTASPSREEALKELSLPALVVHGEADSLVHVENGHETHACIRGSELLLIDGMGHDLPMGTWPRITSAITKLTDSAG